MCVCKGCVCIQVREVHLFILEVVVLFSFLKIHLFNYVFIEHACVIAHMWGPENNLKELILSLCSVALGWYQSSGLGAGGSTHGAGFRCSEVALAGV